MKPLVFVSVNYTTIVAISWNQIPRVIGCNEFIFKFCLFPLLCNKLLSIPEVE